MARAEIARPSVQDRSANAAPRSWAKGLCFVVCFALNWKHTRRELWPTLRMASLEEEEQSDSKRIGKQGLSGGPFFVLLVMHFDKV